MSAAGGEQDPTSPDPRIGVLLEGKYRLDDKLGDGGMGAVYGGLHTSIGRRVAVKVLHPSFVSDSAMLQRFQNEAMATNAIGHPNIVEVTDFGRAPDGSPFLVMELLEGVSLRSYLQERGALSVTEAVDVLIPVCRALHAAHEAQILHRDIKPENVFLTERDGHRLVKVLDFGIAKTAGAAGPTMTGAAIGTPHYMAPEQARGDIEVDRRVDIYAVGVLLFRMLSDSLPHDHESFVVLLTEVATTPAPSIRERRRDLPNELVALVDSMLSLAKEQRPLSAAEVAERLAAFRLTPGMPTLPLDDTGSNPGPSPVPPTAVYPAELPPGDKEPPAQIATLELDWSGRAPAYASTEPNAAQLGATIELDTGMGPALELAHDPPRNSPAPARQKAVGWTAMAVGGLGAVGLAAAFAAWGLAGSEAPSATTASSGAAPASASSYRVRVRIATIPTDASLTLDGEPIANPFEATLPADDTAHQVRAAASGFEPRSETIRFGLPVDLTLEL